MTRIPRAHQRPGIAGRCALGHRIPGHRAVAGTCPDERCPSPVGRRVRTRAGGAMEAKLNVGILCAIGISWATLTLAEPSAALDPRAGSTRDLAGMEDAFAHDRGDPALAESLADAYLDLDRADLAVATLTAADTDV